MSNVLNTQEPSTFPTAISAFPLRTDEMLTANSGSVVPSDNNVNEMIAAGT